MAQETVSVPSFSNALASNSSAFSAPKTTQPQFANTTPAQPAPNRGFVGWLTDILQRPEYTVTNAISNALNTVKDVHTDIVKNEGSGQVLKDIVGNGIIGTPAAAVRGFFSTNPADKHSGAQLIEQASDDLGPIFDSNYKNTKNNVNPVLKGLAGFAADIALDPTTYIPGVDLLTVGKKIVSGGLDAAEGIAAAKDALQAGEGLSSAIGSGVDAAKARSTLMKALSDTKDVAPELTPTGQLAAKLPQTSATLSPDTVAATELPPLSSDIAKPTSLFQPELFKPAETTPVLKPSELLTQPEHAEALTNARQFMSPSKDALQPIPYEKFREAVATKAENSNYIPKVQIAKGKYMPIDKAAQLAPTNRGVRDAYAEYYENYVNDFNDAKKEGRIIDVFGDDIARPDITAHDAVLSRISQLRSTPEGMVRINDALGPDVAQRIARMKSPDKLAKYVQQINDTLDPTFNPDNIITPKQLTRGASDFLAGRGIDVVAQNQLRAQHMADTINAVRSAENGDPVAQSYMAASDAEREADIKSVSSGIRNMLAYKMARYPEVTDTGIERTSKILGEGVGKNSKVLNEFDQYTLSHSVMGDILDDLKKIKTPSGDAYAGVKRARYVSQEFTRRMGLADQILDKYGIPRYIGVTPGEDTLPLSYSQIVNSILKDSGDKANKYLFNGSTFIPETNIMDAVNTMMRGGSDDDLIAELMKDTRRNSDLQFHNNLSSPASARQIGFTPFKPKESAGDGFTYVQTPKGWAKVVNGPEMATNFTQLLRRIQPDLTKTIQDNVASGKMRLGTEVQALTQGAIDKINQWLADPASLSEAVQSVAGASRDIAHLAEATHATQDASTLAQHIVDGQMTDEAVSGSKVLVSNARAIEGSDPETAFDANAARERTYEGSLDPAYDKFIKLQMAEAAGSGRDAAAAGQLQLDTDLPHDITDVTGNRIQLGLQNRWAPLWSMMPGTLTRSIYDMLHGSGVGHVARMESLWNELNNIQRLFPGMVGETETPILQQAFRDLASGMRNNEDTQLGNAYDALENSFGKIWNLHPGTKYSLISNAFFRRAQSIDAVEESITQAFRDSKQSLSSIIGSDPGEGVFDWNAAKVAAKANKTDPLGEALEQWRNWDVDDPIDFINRMQTAVARVNARAATTQDFVQRFMQRGMVSEVKKAGMVKATALHHSTYFPFLPQNLYYDKTLLSAFGEFDRFVSQSNTIGGKLGELVKNYFDPLQRAWKLGMTIYRPGHHIHNLLGDTSMTLMARGPKQFGHASVDAFKIMKLYKEYDGMDFSRSLENLGVRELPKGSDIALSSPFGTHSYQDIANAAFKRGVTPSYGMAESLPTGEAASLTSRVAGKLSLKGTKAEHVVGTISESRDHLSRVQHFMQILHQTKNKLPKGVKTFDDWMDYAGKEVHKFHPDGTVMYAWENKYARRIIPFYSWIRGALPAIVETTLTRPGRVLQFTKGSYALGVMTGANPQSLSDPFPAHQMFPDFLLDEAVGPQINVGGQLYSGTFGIAPVDVADELSNPVQGVAGMVSPLLRVPLELMGGTQWSDGQPITNRADYLDQNLPVTNYIASLTGYSPTGSLLSLLSGHGLQKNAQFAKGNKGLGDQELTALNWLSGATLTNESKPEYANIAQEEQSGGTS